MAGIFAAGLSSLDSALNAMASTFVTDFYKKFRPDRDDAHYLRVSRAAVIAWGAVLGVFACFCVWWQAQSESTLLDFALSVMTFAYGGLVGVFACALFTKRGTNASAIAGLLTGLLVIVAFTVADIAREAPVSLAFPWRLTIAATASFAICVIGPTRKARPSAQAQS